MKTKTLVTLSSALVAAACSSSPSDDSSATATGGAGGGASATATATSVAASSTGSSATAGATASSTTVGSATSTGSGGMSDDVADLPDVAAKAVCGALFRCCDAASLTQFFAPMVADERLAALAPSLPPKATLANEAACVSVLGEVFAIAPFADWVSAAKAGSVDYLAAATDACVSTLASAACGAPVTKALLDGTCFAYAAPGGGAEQRSMFARTDGPGATCAPIRDGVGSTFYGNCDPTSSFCCYEDAAKPGVCALPFDAQGMARTGACKAASALGASCDLLKNVQLCKTGDACDTTTGKCVASKEGPLALGAVCIDKSYNLLGVCVDSFCDVLGTKKCEPLKADGAACNGYDQCASGSCDKGSCGASTFCKG